MNPQRERLDVLDGLRGIAILLVVWYHVWLVSGQAVVGLNFIAEAGYLGVDLFFFISGFCLYLPYARAQLEGRPTPTLRHFVERRAMKIVPSYILALVVFALVYRTSFNSPVDALWQLFAHATFVHPLTPETFGAISGPLWTIGIEVQFYVLFPLIVRVFARSPLFVYLGMAVLAQGYRSAIAAVGASTSFWSINQLPAVIDLFGAGMLGAHAFVLLRRNGGRVDAGRATTVSLCASAFALAGLAAVSIASSTNPDLAHDWINAHRIVIGPVCFVLAVSTFFATPAWRAVLTARALVFLSTISYNLYLWHLEIFVWVHDIGLAPAWTFALSVPLAIGVACVMTNVIERPFLSGAAGVFWRTLRPRLAVGTSRASSRTPT